MPVSRRCWFLFASLVLLPALSAAQSFNGAITGVVRDSSHAVIPDAALTLRDVGKDQIVATAVSGADGEYAFRNLAPARYEVTATKDGFRQVVLPGIDVTLSSVQRLDVELPVGTQTERVEVVGGSSVLSTTATQEHGISPETLNQLPLLMNSGPRVVGDVSRCSCPASARAAATTRSTRGSTAACSRATRRRSTASACSRAS